MGNSQVDTSVFPLSNLQWVATSEPNCLYCPSASVYANYARRSCLTKPDIDIYCYRANNKQYLVNMLAILDASSVKFKQKQVLSMHSNNTDSDTHVDCSAYLVLTQKIQYRLPDLGTISYADGLYILRQGVNAIRLLSDIYDNFVIEEECIGINSRGECKYWVNCSYDSNQVGAEVGSGQADRRSQGETELNTQQSAHESNDGYSINKGDQCWVSSKYNRWADTQQSSQSSNHNRGNAKNNNQHYSNRSKGRAQQQRQQQRQLNPETEDCPCGDTLTISNVDDTNATKGSTNERSRHGNVGQLLQGLMRQIESRMWCSLNRQQQGEYRQYKERYLVVGASDNRSVGSVRVGSYTYNLANAQKLIASLCTVQGISSSYTIKLPCVQQNHHIRKHNSNSRSNLSLRRISSNPQPIPSLFLLPQHNNNNNSNNKQRPWSQHNEHHDGNGHDSQSSGKLGDNSNPKAQSPTLPLTLTPNYSHSNSKSNKLSKISLKLKNSKHNNNIGNSNNTDNSKLDAKYGNNNSNTNQCVITNDKNIYSSSIMSKNGDYNYKNVNSRISVSSNNYMSCNGDNQLYKGGVQWSVDTNSRTLKQRSTQGQLRVHTQQPHHTPLIGVLQHNRPLHSKYVL